MGDEPARRPVQRRVAPLRARQPGDVDCSAPSRTSPTVCRTSVVRSTATACCSSRSRSAAVSRRSRSSRRAGSSSNSCSTRTRTRRDGSELRERQHEDPGRGRDEGLRDEDGARACARACVGRGRGRGARVHPRAERLRQDDAPLGDVGSPPADPRPGRARRVGRRRAPARSRSA